MRILKLAEIVRRAGGVRKLSRASGVSASMISMLLSGRRKMGAAVAVKLACAANGRAYFGANSVLKIGR